MRFPSLFRQFQASLFPNLRRRHQPTAACMPALERLEQRDYCAADLVVSGVDVYYNPDTDFVRCTVQVRNQGNATVDLNGDPLVLGDEVGLTATSSANSVPGSVNDVFLGTTLTYEQNNDPVFLLGPGQVATAVIESHYVFNQNRPFLLFKIDSSNQVSEGSGESNNTFKLDMRDPQLAFSPTPTTVESRHWKQIALQMKFIDHDTPAFDGGVAVITLENPVPGESLRLRSKGQELRISHGKIIVGGVQVGVLHKAPDGTQLIMEFNENATRPRLTTVLFALEFKAAKRPAGSTTKVIYEIADGTGHSAIPASVTMKYL